MNSFVGGSSSIYTGCKFVTDDQERVSVIKRNISSVWEKIGV